MEICTKFPTTRKNIHILAYFAHPTVCQYRSGQSHQTQCGLHGYDGQGEPFHVVTFDKSQHEYYAKLSDFHAQFRMVGNRSAIGRFACKEL